MIVVVCGGAVTVQVPVTHGVVSVHCERVVHVVSVTVSVSTTTTVVVVRTGAGVVVEVMVSVTVESVIVSVPWQHGVVAVDCGNVLVSVMVVVVVVVTSQV